MHRPALPSRHNDSKKLISTVISLPALIGSTSASAANNVYLELVRRHLCVWRVLPSIALLRPSNWCSWRFCCCSQAFTPAHCDFFSASPYGIAILPVLLIYACHQLFGLALSLLLRTIVGLLHRHMMLRHVQTTDQCSPILLQGTSQ